MRLRTTRGQPQPTRDHNSLQAALAQLRLRLLDLSGRNRLLNFKHTPGKSLQFIEGQLAAIYQKLVDGNNKPSVTILGLPEPARGDWVERNGRLSRPDPREWARQQGIPTSYDLPDPDGIKNHSNVRALLYPDDLAKHCRKIEREANLATEETGAHMLFLVLGFLEFPDQRESDRLFTAPLISVPVSMSRRESGGNQVFSLQYTGEDISENLSLREKLKTDHSLILPELEEDQVDVEGYFSAIQKIIKHYPGFAFRRRVSLCLLSFTNMLLVRDLDPSKWPQFDNQHSLLDHPIVREVFEGSAEKVEDGLGIAREHSVEDGPGATIALVYDADSSQHSALVDVLIGRKNLVIEGPPGTGKSQTITNLIAACLAEGKKVLFVAEKLAALEVVKNRLSLAGLGSFVLELHSNKTNKKRVLEELAQRIDYKPHTLADLPRKLQQLEAHRNDLRTYSDLVNSVSYNRFGLTLHQVMWRAEKYRLTLSIEHAFLTQISIRDAGELSEFELFRRMDCLRYLGAQYDEIGGFDTDSTFWGFFPERIIPGDEVRLQTVFTSATQWSQTFVADAEAYSDLLNSKIVGLTYRDARSQLEILHRFLNTADTTQPLHLFPRWFGTDTTGNYTQRVLESLATQLSRYHELTPIARAGLKHETAAREDLLSHQRQLDRAATALGVSLGTPVSVADLLSVLQAEVERLGTSHEAIDAFCSEKHLPYDGTRTRLEQLVRLVRLVGEMPEEYLHLHTPGLTREGCVHALEALVKLQDEWQTLQKELDEILYLDALPQEGALKQAILTLRQGSAWYRIFQSRWRSAIALHKSLQRTKKRLPAAKRLSELEKINQLLQLKERWKTDPAWGQYLHPTVPSESLSLTGHLLLARWHREVKVLSEELQSPTIVPEDLTPERARAFRREFARFSSAISTAVTALQVIDGLLPKLADTRSGQHIESLLEQVGSLTEAITNQLPWLTEHVPAQATLSVCLAACQAAIERRTIANDIENNAQAKELLADRFAGVDTEVTGALAALAFGQGVQGLDLPTPMKAKLTSGHPLHACRALIAALEKVTEGLQSVESFTESLQNYGDFDVATWVNLKPEEDLLGFAKTFKDRIKDALTDTHLLISWSLYVARQKEAQELGLDEFVMLIESKRAPASELADVYAYCTYATIVREAFRQIPQLGRFSGLKHNQIREEFKRLDREIIQLRGRAIAGHCHRGANPPGGRNGSRVEDKTEMVLINYLLPQQRPRMPVRKMLSRAGSAIQALKPCFMMGPQAVAQYLTPGAVTFDLVIMDEASQLKPEEAIGAIARGTQLVVVGDPKQLPPTSFFSRLGQTEDGDEQFTTTEAESILDVCLSHFHPPRPLRWHYRSRHHSLIAFSNHNFYRGNLIVFPSPYGQSRRLGVCATYLADAVYDNQTNLTEAKRVVDAAVEHILNRKEESLGIVTLNMKQRDLIAELLDERLQTIREADAYREQWASEGYPLFVKNLENVQGDERDAIIISTTFGKPPNSTAVRQNFGPISRQDGWRRLNVLFTRARKSISIYTSLRPEDIVVDRTTPEGTKALRNYLEYARTGSLVIAEDTGHEPDSDFEIAVIDVLRSRGYEVTPQLGVAGYRIDMAVKHPDAPGTYLAAIECDGASYHSALSVRDRDRIRQEILESLGWRGRIWRIWSTDWFRAPRLETEKLLGFLEDVRRSWKPEHFSGESWVEERISATHEPGIQSGAEMHEREVVENVLLETEDDLEVKVGDVVKYVDLAKPDELLQVRITPHTTDIANGEIAETTPLAQVLLGAVVGDEVSLQLSGVQAKTFHIQEINRTQEALHAISGQYDP